ncbi:MAG: phosphoribosylformylglycinamidine synthase subunit PurQ, partial [Wenzhouxiangellaceae bacterium]
SMQTRWQADGEDLTMTAPVSLNVTAFSPVPDVRACITPELRCDCGNTELLLLAPEAQRLGGSALAVAFGRALGEVPDMEQPALLAALFDTVQALVADQRILALHDRSDGGLLTTVLEMALAGHSGVELELPPGCDPLAWLFNEEAGLVIQCRAGETGSILETLETAGLADWATRIGRVTDRQELSVMQQGSCLLRRDLVDLNRIWAATSYRMQRLRDHPGCADEEYAALADWNRPGLRPVVTFDRQAPAIVGAGRPKVAILREQGVNGQREMAMAFHGAGFEAVDVHMSDLETGRQRLADFHGLAVCGGFSFGDVLGAGRGWARSILFNGAMREQFQHFFADSGKFALGVCNGCQVLSAMAEIIPGSDHWPRFVHNRSRRFEARLSLVEIVDSPSLMLRGMAGSRLPVATAHGEGRADFGDAGDWQRAPVAVRYVDAGGSPAQTYPDNP